MRALRVLGVLSAVAAASPAVAQIRPGSIEFGAAGGIWEGDEYFDDAGMFALRAGFNLTRVFGLELRYSGIPTTAHPRTQTATGAVDMGNEDKFVSQFGLGAVLNLNDAIVNPYLSGGVGMVVVDETDLAANIGMGVRWHITELFMALADLRGWFSGDAPANDQYAHFQATLGFGVQFGGDFDIDDDGIPNVDDGCPTQAEDKDGFEDTDGCVDADNDADGVLDADDKCPDKAEDKDGDRDEDGCPDVDADGDGIGDEADKCVDQAEDKDGFEDEDGCPDLDNDADGIPDTADACPLEAETKNNWADADGCPEGDADKDGIFDLVDKCKDAPENRNGFEDLDGCSEEIPAEVQAILGIQAGVTFEPKSEALFKRSLPALDALAAVIKRYPAVVFEVQATAHGVPNADELATKRATNVWTYLTQQGIAETALRARGIGDAALPADAPAGTKPDRIEVRIFVPEQAPVPPEPSAEELQKLRGGK